MRLDMTFRFWKRKSIYFTKNDKDLQKNFGRNHPVGVVMINYLAVGEAKMSDIDDIEYQSEKLMAAYQQLSERFNDFGNPSVRMSYLYQADQEEGKSRRRYIESLRAGNLMEEWEQVAAKSKELLEKNLVSESVREEAGERGYEEE